MNTKDFKFDFNPAPPTMLHIDLNSCFATIEQQANPLLRGKPVAVAAYTASNGCILAASVEAKRLGVKTGLRVREGRKLCPNLVILPSDPAKYRFVNRQLLSLLQSYTDDVEVRSIDEMVLNLAYTPALENQLGQITKISSHHTENCYIAKLLNCYEDKNLGSKNNNLTIQSPPLAGSRQEAGQFNNFRNNNFVIRTMIIIAQEIKERIKSEIGEWLTVSIGISTNRYLAKIASGLHKPDGLDVISADNIEKILKGLKLEDLCGIKEGYGGRLRRFGITTPLQLYQASAAALKAAFASRIGDDWGLWLHGYESDLFDRGKIKSIGHSYALKVPYTPRDPRLHQILCQLVEKMGRRLRENGFLTQGIRISCLFADHSFWNHGEKLRQALFASNDLYKEALRVLKKAPAKPVRILAVSCFYLADGSQEQLDLLESWEQKKRLTQAIDTIADRWGEFTIFPARMLGMEQKVLDRIAFGGVAGLEEVVFHEPVITESDFSA